MLRQRIITALIAIPCVVAAVWWLPTRWLALPLALLLLAGALEWTVFMRLGTRGARALYVLLVAVLFYLLWRLREHEAVLDGVLFLSLAWWCFGLLTVARYPLGALMRGSSFGQPSALGVLQTGIAGMITLAPAFVAFLHLHAAVPRGPAWILILLVLVWAADTGAYFTGRTLGRRKLAPNVSPGKTREGAAGGIVISVVVTALLGAYALGIQGGALLALVLLTGVVGVFSIVGDLLVSVFKRTAGVKDSGVLFPGHGGVLDRMDSLLAAAPLFLLGLTLARLQ